MAINVASASTSIRKLGSQKAKEWGGASRQSSCFIPSHVVLQTKDSIGQEKIDIYSKDRFR